VPKLRRIGVVLLLAALVGGWASRACSGSAADGPFHELRYEQWAGGLRFLVPAEHWPGEAPIFGNLLVGGRDAKAFSVHFRSGWLAAHVPGFRPVLNGGYQGTLVTVSARSKAPDPGWRPEVSRISVDLWHGRGHSPDRVVTGLREPNTGLHIVKAMHGHWLWYLTDRVPRPDEPIPTAPPWRVLICSHTRPALVPDAVAYTDCNQLRIQVTPEIFVSDIGIAGENLRVRSEVLNTIARHVLLWRLNGAVQEEA